MNIHNIINDISLTNGDTKRMDCPECGGRKTFTITNNMGSIVWNCYKAGCTVSGGKRTHLTAEDIRKSLGSVAEETHAVKFDKPEWIVYDNAAIQDFCDQWRLDPDMMGLMYDVKEHRVVFPNRHNGVMVDASGRTLGKLLPKWKRYGNSSLPYTFGCGKTAVVVEDCVSAAIVGATEMGSGCSDGDGFVGVAVLGTSLSEGHRQYLSQFSTAIIALDPDALPKTLQFAKELRGHVPNVKVLRLQDDLKYHNPTDFKNLQHLGET
ncbi:DNA primase [Roseobacter phage CRP-345]|nr:DNA primase [Roseobacter phage CRP-345]